ncbi:MAG: hypothetical protein AMJ59_14215 [Gammaproteobacteria bacterium SG8_31]|nr:MAG: hypothetical protein AMJ59_14215 [Gammaproteobacteria bacterium SG8_31]
MEARILSGILGILVLVLQSPVLAADAPDTLKGFERLVGGCWRLEETCQEFEFGLDGRHVTARTLAQTQAGKRVISEGAWFYHPGKDVAIGYFVAKGMGVELFEYSTRFEGETMTSDVTAWDETGQPRVYRENWTFTDPDHYLWELFETESGSMTRVMHGIFARERAPETGE